MELSGIGQYLAAQNNYASQKRETVVTTDDKKAAPVEKDTVILSGNVDYLQVLQKQFQRTG